MILIRYTALFAVSFQFFSTVKIYIWVVPFDHTYRSIKIGLFVGLDPDYRGLFHRLPTIIVVQGD